MGEITENTIRRARVVGYLGSGGTALILFLILFFTYLITPIPPYPEGGGGQGMDIEVNLGYADAGLGDIQQPDIEMPEFNEVAANTPPPVKQPKEEVLSQENEETATIVNPPKTKKKIKPRPTQPEAQKTIITRPKPVVEKPRTANPAALYKRDSKSGSTGSQGNTKGSTDQGSPNGLQGSATYGKGGSGGTGSGGGTGGGTGTGTGTGIGNGVGPGISFNLEGRSMILIRKPEFSQQREGIVVVEITVDRNGNVINATPGLKGSTIVDNILYAAARKAALESKFNLKRDAPDRQIGKIIYHFKLQ